MMFFPWTKGDDVEDSKYLYVVHAELNAILNCRGENLNGTTIFVTHFPCNECAKAIIQSGIKNIIYLNKHDEGEKCNLASRKMLDAAGIVYKAYDGKDISFIDLNRTNNQVEHKGEK